MLLGSFQGPMTGTDEAVIVLEGGAMRQQGLMKVGQRRAA
ncbi:hypothetical protein BH23CHL7_BH23CHL7_23210 [soil metagenome]|jgi:hypothetical protein